MAIGHKALDSAGVFRKVGGGAKAATIAQAPNAVLPAPILGGKDGASPSFALFVDGVAVSTDVSDHIISVSLEQTTEMASMIRLTVENIDHEFTDSKVFEPGKEVDLWGGYGNALGYLGRAELIRHLPNFPQEGVPVIEIQGYDRFHRFTKNEVRVGDDTSKKETDKRGKTYIGTYGSVVAEIFLRRGVEPRIDPELMLKPIPGQTPGVVGNTYRKAGTTDAEFLRALANMAGCECFLIYEMMTAFGGAQPGLLIRRRRPVDAMPATPGRWVGVFRKPPRSTKFAHHVFKYRMGEASSLISVDLEFAIPDAITEITVMFLNRFTGAYEALDVKKEAASTSPKFKEVQVDRMVPAWQINGARKLREEGGANQTQIKKAITEEEFEKIEHLSKDEQKALAARSGKTVAGTKTVKIGLFNFKVPTTKVIPANTMKRRNYAYTRKKVKVSGGRPATFSPGGAATVFDGSTPLKIGVGGYAFVVEFPRKFRSVEEAYEYAKNYILANQDQLVIAHGVLEGEETLAAGEVHELDGLGKFYSGDYYFFMVNHQFSDSGYRTLFSARKMLG